MNGDDKRSDTVGNRNANQTFAAGRQDGSSASRGTDGIQTQSFINAMNKLKDKLTMEDSPIYQQVDSDIDSLTTSNTATSLDTILPEEPIPLSVQTQQLIDTDLPPIQFSTSSTIHGLESNSRAVNQQKSQDSSAERSICLPRPVQPTSRRDHFFRGSGDDIRRSKQSLRGSRISFEKTTTNENESSDDDSFEDRRAVFQQQKTISVDRKGILKDLKTILATDNRRQFQTKKHVSLDIKGTRHLNEFLKESSSDEEFIQNRKEYQGRKHQSLDPRVTFRLSKVLQGSSTESDEELADVEHKHLIHRPKDITKPVVIDLKDLEVSESEDDYLATRQHFQQHHSISIESKKSQRLYEMEESVGKKKSENLRNAVPFVRQITEDGKPKLEVYRPTTNPIYIWTQVLAAFSVSLGSLVVGFSSAYTSPALVSMTDCNITSFEVTPQAASWVGGVMPLAGLAGGIAGGPFIEYLGRRNTILATAIPFVIAWLLIASAVNVAMVLAGRALAGFCVGIASLSLPVYLGETIQPEVRGTLGLLPTVFGNIGILLCFVIGTYLNWSNLALFGGFLPIPFLILMFLIPETPRWYVSRNREEKARKALIWLRGNEANVEPELKGLVRTQADTDRNGGKNQLLQLMKWHNLKPLSISLGLMFFQQFSGINAVIFYTVSIFQDAGSTIDGNICTIIVGVVNFIATFIATILIDRLGRKVLLYISDLAMIVTLFTLGGFFYCKSIGMHTSEIGWLPLLSFVIYVVGFSLGFGPIPWLMMGEILPSKIRGSAASVATAFNWTCTFIVTKTFRDMIDAMGAHGAFWLFGVVCIIGLFFVIFCVPETQGKSLEDIERKMMGRVRRMSSVANMKPLSFNM